ncbi:MAG: FHA domain-containing protein [Myxococcota bacterium]|nr:FHA domain-containing protein [Myxococcota bacterium]
MRDGFTRRVDVQEKDLGFDDFMAKWCPSVVILSGEASGTEWVVEKANVTIGRGEDCDWTVPDDAVSKEHATLEFADGGFRIRDLGSRNGMLVNGSEVKVAELASADRFQLGEHEFQFILEKRDQATKTWVLPDDA